MVGWVFFRAESVSSAFHLLGSMAGADGIYLPGMLSGRLGGMGSWLMAHGVTFDLERALVLPSGQWIHAVPWIMGLLFIALFFPNTQQFLHAFKPAYDAPAQGPMRGLARIFSWKPTMPYALYFGVLAMLALVFLMLSRQTEFLYFQF